MLICINFRRRNKLEQERRTPRAHTDDWWTIGGKWLIDWDLVIIYIAISTKLPTHYLLSDIRHPIGRGFLPSEYFWTRRSFFHLAFLVTLSGIPLAKIIIHLSLHLHPSTSIYIIHYNHVYCIIHPTLVYISHSHLSLPLYHFPHFPPIDGLEIIIIVC